MARSFFRTLHAAFHQPGSSVYRAVESTVWTLILLSVALFFLELALPAYAEIIQRADMLILSLFALELVLRVATYRPPQLELFRRSVPWRVRVHVTARLRYLMRPLMLIDLATVLALVGPLRMLRALRLLRLLRTARLFRYSSPVLNLLRTFEENALLFHSALSLLLLTIVVGGLTVFLRERAVNPALSSIGDGIWWALVTVTTVGYGDVTPVTPMGKVIAGAMMVLGMFTLALFAGIVASTLLTVVLRLRHEQFRMSSRANHLVICGYEPGAGVLLDVLLEEYRDREQHLVIFCHGARPLDVPPEFTWIEGDPTKESELDKARVYQAAAVIVIGGRQVSPQHADATTLLTIFTVRSFMSKHADRHARRRPLRVIAEVLEPENVEHARTAGADEVIQTKRLGFSLLAHATLYPGAGETMTRVALSGSYNLYIGLPELPGGPINYGVLAHTLKEDHQATVLGLRDASGRIALGPQDNTPVTAEHEVIYLAAQPVLRPSTA
jgi:voltage-gated potassium channel Kch